MPNGALRERADLLLDADRQAEGVARVGERLVGGGQRRERREDRVGVDRARVAPLRASAGVECEAGAVERRDRAHRGLGAEQGLRKRVADRDALQRVAWPSRRDRASGRASRCSRSSSAPGEPVVLAGEMREVGRVVVGRGEQREIRSGSAVTRRRRACRSRRWRCRCRRLRGSRPWARRTRALRRCPARAASRPCRRRWGPGCDRSIGRFCVYSGKSVLEFGTMTFMPVLAAGQVEDDERVGHRAGVGDRGLPHRLPAEQARRVHRGDAGGAPLHQPPAGELARSAPAGEAGDRQARDRKQLRRAPVLHRRERDGLAIRAARRGIGHRHLHHLSVGSAEHERAQRVLALETLGLVSGRGLCCELLEHRLRRRREPGRADGRVRARIGRAGRLVRARR